MTFNPSRYDYVYGIHLLDDIHNLFPEFLYDSGLFPGNSLITFLQMRVNELFPEDYVRMRTHYRLYQMERRREAVIPTTPVRPVRNVRMPEAPRQTRRFTTTNTTTPVTTYTVPLTTLLQPTDTIASLFTTALFGTQHDLSDLLTPVPVAPTTNQINAASIVSNLEPAGEVTCTICQDHDHPTSQEWRILRHCGHRFHRPCIDTWFQQHVQCPVCRHDIRNINASENDENDES